jgi:hypothetical protein
MKLKTFGLNGVETIVVNDDATNEEIAIAMMIAAMEEPGNGKPRKAKEEHDG